MSYRVRTLFSLLLATVLVASACNPARNDNQGNGAGGGGSAAASQDPKSLSGTINVWFFGVDNPTAQARADLFQKTYPNIKVNFTPGGFEAQKFLTAVTSGNPPDVVHMPREVIGSYALRGSLQPLDDYIKSSGFDTSVFYEPALKAAQVDGKTFGMPQFNNTRMVYINNKALREVGLTADDVDFGNWEKLTENNQKLAKMNGSKVARVGIDPKLPGSLPFWAAANGASIISDDGKESKLDDPKVVEALKFAVSLLQPGGGQAKYAAFTQSWAPPEEAKNPFAQNQVGIYLEEQWYLGALGRKSPDLDVTVKPLKKRDGSEFTFGGGLAWVMPRGVKNPQLAWEFMRFMSSEQQWVAAAEASKQDREGSGAIYTGTFTANKKADDQIFKDVYKPTGKKPYDDGVQAILSVQDKVTSLPPNGAGQEVIRAMEDAVNKVLAGKATPEEALAAADKEAQAALDRAKGS